MVRGDSALTADDDLFLRADTYGDGSSPTDIRVTWRAPQLLAASRIKRRHERSAPMILKEDDAIPIQKWRPSRPMVVVDRSDLLVPRQLAVECERRQPSTTERHIHEAAISRRRCRRVPVFVVSTRCPTIRHERFP